MKTFKIYFWRALIFSVLSLSAAQSQNILKAEELPSSHQVQSLVAIENSILDEETPRRMLTSASLDSSPPLLSKEMFLSEIEINSQTSKNALIVQKKLFSLEKPQTQKDIETLIFEQAIPLVLEKVIDVSYVKKNKEIILKLLKKNSRRFVFSISTQKPSAVRVFKHDLQDQVETVSGLEPVLSLSLSEESNSELVSSLNLKNQERVKTVDIPPSSNQETLWLTFVKVKISLSNLKNILNSNQEVYMGSIQTHIMPFFNFINLTEFQKNYMWWKKGFSEDVDMYHLLESLLKGANEKYKNKLFFSTLKGSEQDLDQLDLKPSLQSVKILLKKKSPETKIVILGNVKVAPVSFENQKYKLTSQFYVHHIEGPGLANSSSEEFINAANSIEVDKKFKNFIKTSFDEIVHQISKKDMEDLSNIYNISLLVELDGGDYSHFRAIQEDLNLRIPSIKNIALDQISSSSVKYAIKSNFSPSDLLKQIKKTQFNSFVLLSSSQTWGDDLVLIIKRKKTSKKSLKVPL